MSILAFVIVDDLRHYRIRNGATLVLFVLSGAACAATGNTSFILAHIAFSSTIFVFLLGAYALGLTGGGDVKLLVAALLWIGPEMAMMFAVFLFGLTWTYWLGVKLRIFPFQEVDGRTKVPFGPSIAVAWMVTIVAVTFGREPM